LVSGGNSGIGRATAARLAGLGAHVILSGRQLRQILTEYAQHCNDHRPH
jgi:NAD(P)-dependent dehydrogenase (short-subunit alcohol dehydrogenase family)